MRELKFKAQNEKGNWVYFSIWEVNPPLKREMFKNLCMFTGKHDVHGDEIYEGHILKYENPEYPNHKPYVIRWSEDDCCFECVNSDNFMLPNIWCEMEIIGNVFDNLVIINKCLILDIMANPGRKGDKNDSIN